MTPQENERAMALLCAFTPNQIRLVGDFVRSRTEMNLGREVEEYRGMSGFVPPMLTVLDLPYQITGQDIRDLETGLTLVIRDSLAGQWNRQQYRIVLQRAAGIPSDLADKLVDKIVTPDSGVMGWYDTIARWIPDLPYVPVDDAMRALAGAGVNAISALYSWLSERQKSADTLYEYLQLGRTIREMGKRALLTAKEKDLEDDVAGSLAMDQLNTQVASGKATAASLATALLPMLLGLLKKRQAALGAAAAGVAQHLLGPSEGGDFGEYGDVEYGQLEEAKQQYYGALDAMTTQVTPYDKYEAQHPEQGGFFSALKKVGRFAAKTALGPVGGAAFDAASGLIEQASRSPSRVEPDRTAGGAAEREARQYRRRRGPAPQSTAGRQLCQIPYDEDEGFYGTATRTGPGAF